MEQFFEKNKKMVIIGVVVIVLLIGGVIAMSSRSKPAPEQVELTDEEALDEPIPTVDSSVKVSLNALNGKKEVEVVVVGAPKGTENIDVELSYETTDKGLQGAIGNMDVSKGETKKKITLGTCSSGTCVYHNVSSEIKVDLKFNGDYGEKIFQKSYSL